MRKTNQAAAKTQSSNQGKLILVPTPIGNLADISLRALEILKTADVILCEDTRVTRKLLNHYNITTRAAAYHDYSSDKERIKWLNLLNEGKTLALVSDAGTPLVSDPGYKLVREAIDAEYIIEALPGASAILPALSASGLPTDQFFFAGFLPHKDKARKTTITNIKDIPATLIFYESPSRLLTTIAALLEIMGDRQAVIARELTKLHEEIARGSLSELHELFSERERIRGEIVIVVERAKITAEDDDIDEQITQALGNGESVKSLAERLGQETNIPKRHIYNRALALRDDP